jgi:phosphopantothenoylcysteine decarboxylase/phosphopantothenate--cysteine ligase
MKDIKILITAGPTYEKIDPVRFIGNYSSGKMGFALARECAERGAQVTLIAGPVSLATPHPAIRRIDVESALEMYDAAMGAFAEQDAAILCAAVADYRPATVADTKIKRTEEEMVIRLVANPDIAASLGRVARPEQTLAGFALETDNARAHALDKLRRKNLDFIVLNSLAEAGAGFQVDTNRITILTAQGEQTDYPLKPKSEVAVDIVDRLEQVIASKLGRL